MSSVNWQNNSYYQALKDYEKETGTTLAERNAMANPYGSHSFGGVLLSQLLPQLLVGGAEKIAGGGLKGSGDTGSKTDIASETMQNAELGRLTSRYDGKLDASNIDKYIKELDSFKTLYPKNKRIDAAIAEAKKMKQNNNYPTRKFGV